MPKSSTGSTKKKREPIRSALDSELGRIVSYSLRIRWKDTLLNYLRWARLDPVLTKDKMT